ncbi:MAG: hypothetical protein ACRELD_06275 [Longimicrobiales bacterium]
MLRSTALFILLAALALSAACDDPFGTLDWPAATAVPDTVELFSLGRSELLGLPSAFDLTDQGRRRVVVEQQGASGAWDIALVDEAGGLSLMPPGALQGVAPTSSSGIHVVSGTSFEALERAPTDRSAFTDSLTVPLRVGAVYVVRTRPLSLAFGRCVYHAKLEALEVDVAGGTFLFHYMSNPNCNDPALVPPDDD